MLQSESEATNPQSTQPEPDASTPIVPGSTDKAQKPLPLGLQLDSDEVIVYRTRSFFRWYYWIFGLIIGAIPAFLRRLRTDYVVTNKRIIDTHGSLIRSQHILPIEKIQDVRLKQGPFASWLGYGDAMFETAGERSGDVIKLIDGPRQFRDAVQGQMRKSPPAGP